MKSAGESHFYPAHQAAILPEMELPELLLQLVVQEKWPTERVSVHHLRQPDLQGHEEFLVQLLTPPLPTLDEYESWYHQLVPEDSAPFWPPGIPGDSLVLGTLGDEFPIVLTEQHLVLRVAFNGSAVGAWVDVAESFTEFAAILGLGS